MSSTKSDEKLCKVCGDKAMGFNFKAITCESCKAFFRRNAVSGKKFKCPYKQKCDITIVTRKFCQKCRLDKCFAIGMCENLIMTEEEKIAKRRKIEENRRRKLIEYNPSGYHSQYNSLANFESAFSSLHLLPRDAVSDNSTGSSYQSIDVTRDGAHFSRMDSQYYLDASDLFKLQELLEANEAFDSVPHEAADINTSDALTSFLNYTTMKLKRLSKFSSKLSSFTTMCRECQCAMLKRAGLDVIVLKRLMDEINPITNRLGIRSSTFRDHIEALRLSDVDHGAFPACVESFDRIPVMDKKVIVLLCAVTLFSPDRPNVVHRDAVEKQQDSYRRLLRRYLRTVCGESELEEIFAIMMQTLAKVRTLTEGFIGVPLRPGFLCIDQLVGSKK